MALVSDNGRYIATHLAKDINRDILIKEMVGRELGAMFPKETVPIGDVALSVKRTSRHAPRSISSLVQPLEFVPLMRKSVRSRRMQFSRTKKSLTSAPEVPRVPRCVSLDPEIAFLSWIKRI
jgi:hypothetical protein